MNDPAPLLAITGLEVTFQTYRGTVLAVRSAHLTVNPGEMVALVGESGSGKTMTARAVLGLLPPGGRVTAGTVTFEGHDMVTADPRTVAALRGRGIAMVFQNAKASLNPSMRVGDQIGEALQAHRGADRMAAAARAVDLLDRVGIQRPAERSRAYPHERSGGMCQRAAVAMALACGPRLLIADEPTTGLDVTTGTEMMGLLAEIRECEGLAVLIITHDLGMVARYCDRMVVMNDGRVVEEGPVLRVFEEPEDPYTRMLLEQTIGSSLFHAARERAASEAGA
jgi:peptide/nickel transport system ATP-binding protein